METRYKWRSNAKNARRKYRKAAHSNKRNDIVLIDRNVTVISRLQLDCYGLGPEEDRAGKIQREDLRRRAQDSLRGWRFFQVPT